MGFCSNCGSEIKEGTAFCSKCGARVGDAAQQTSDYNQGTPNYSTNSYGDGYMPGNKPNNNKMIGMAVVGVAAVVVLFLLFKFIGLFTTPAYEKPIKYVCDGMEKGSAKTMMKAFPDYIVDQLEDNYGDMDEFMDSMTENLEDSYGKRVKISFKVTDKEKIDKDDISDLEDEIESYYDENVNIKAAYNLEVEMKIKGSEDDDENDDELTVIKVGSKWYLYDQSFLY